MCVIAICDEERVTDEQVEQMFDANDAGAGIAWRDSVKEKGVATTVVRWQKGLDLEEVKKLCRDVPMPFTVHFRIPTEGGRTAALCHPFPVEKDVPLNIEGTTKGFVLFHNGHWSAWKNSSLEASVRSNTPVPSGKWSDTRAMAYHAAIYGPGILEFIEQKAVLFGTTRVEIFGPKGAWDRVGNIWVSNKSWEGRGNSFRTNDHRRNFAGIAWPGRKELPAADADETTVVDVKSHEPSKQTRPQVPEGVDLDKLPFEQVTAMFEREEISKKQWKKQRRRWDLQQLGRKAKRQQHSTIH